MRPERCPRIPRGAIPVVEWREATKWSRLGLLLRVDDDNGNDEEDDD